jgi:hypothetical protein
VQPDRGRVQAHMSTVCASFNRGVSSIRKKQVYACIRKEMGIVFFWMLFGMSVFSAHAGRI